ncbi:MAG: asparagine synthase (glutamine-hydrolyzing) [Ginsengibacter sp.]
MCGIAGIISPEIQKVNLPLLKKMTGIIAHRGPDGEGHWISENGKVGFGHRRLSIIDLSHQADQPMHFSSRYTIVFNGEIYNYIELKAILSKKGYTFKTESDTEVLMALYDYKKEDCLGMLDGMFAFALYDKDQNELFIARDRFGEKPFYYSYIPGKHFLFGSEMKCLWAAGVQKEVNNRMLFSYLSDGSIHNQQDLSETFYHHCSNFPNSHYGKLSIENCELSINRYYDIHPENINHSITKDQAIERFRELFYTSVNRRLRSDVAVGSSLSGGLDSSLVVCAIDELKRSTHQKQNTFSAVFPGFAKDERQYMDFVINKTNVLPHFITPGAEGLINDFEDMFRHQEEPFGSASIYVQYCVMRLAKENNVTVLLDGQGADEYLAGYHPYFNQYFNDLRINYPDRYASEYAAYLKLHKDNMVNPVIKKDLRYYVRSRIPGLLKPAKSVLQYYHHQRSPFFSKEFYDDNFKQYSIPEREFKGLSSVLYQSLYQGDLQNLLRFCDRNSMAHSREVRLPFLYHELVDFVFSLPPYLKIHSGWTKWIMRKAFEDLLPEPITWRKDKIGYEPPQKNWIVNQQMKDMIHESKIILYQKNIISKKEYEHETGNRTFTDGRMKSWGILMAGNLLK